ncbi:MAG: TetR/AcrR family transcriptional repressor of mexCD-oprJ operon [Moritella dasanensis]|jgi:TetR/AcrR family transcriptional repressor of mexCD-oprJ operon
MKFNDARLEKSNDAILDAALIALTENPETPFTEISRLARVGRATLYRMYSTRELLVEALILRCLDKVDNEVSISESKALSTKHFFEIFFATMLDLEYEYRFMSKFTPQNHTSAEIKKRCSRQESEIISLIQLAQDEGLIDKKLPPQWVARLMDGVIYAMWEFNKIEINPNKSAKLAMQSFFSGTGNIGFFGTNSF